MPSGNETVTIIKEVNVDRLDDLAVGPAQEFDLDNCQVIPRQAQEEGRGWVNIDGWDIWCFTEPPEPVLSTYRVRVRGVEYQIEGKPGAFDKKGDFKALSIKTIRAGATA